MTDRHIRWFASKSSPEAGIMLQVDEAHLARIRKARRWLCVGEDVRKAA